MSQMCCGGTGSEKPIDDEVKSIVEKIRPQVESKLGAIGEFTPVSYRSQVVAGTNYFVKIHTGNGKYIHARIYQDLSNNIKLHGLKSDLGENDGLEYFEANPEFFDD